MLHPSNRLLRYPCGYLTRSVRTIVDTAENRKIKKQNKSNIPEPETTECLFRVQIPEYDTHGV